MNTWKILLVVIWSLFHINLTFAQDDILSKTEIEEDLEFLLTSVEQIHPSPFRVNPKHEWDSLKNSIIGQAPIDYSTFYTEVLRLISYAQDGHMDAYPKSSSSVRLAFPFKAVLFPEGLFVVAASPEFKSLLGAEILEMEGFGIREVLEKLSTIVPSDNEWGKQELLEDYLRMPVLLKALGVENDHQGFQFRMNKEGSNFEVSFNTELAEEALPVGPPRRPLPNGWLDVREELQMSYSVWQQNTGKLFWYTTLPELNALYIQINLVLESETGEFAQFIKNLPLPKQSDLPRLIIDLRTNRGGNATLLNPLLHAIIKHWDYLNPGNIFVLTSNYTFSAAVHLAADIEKNTHAIFLGEATAAPANHYADVKIITLPNSGIEVEISDLYWQKSDPRDTRLALYPDIVVPLTWEDFIYGRDPAFKKISDISANDSLLQRNRKPFFNWFRDSQKE